MKGLYTKLINTFTRDENIKDRYRQKGLSPVQHIDLYSSQDTNPEYFEVQLWPALFISFSMDHRQTPTLATVTVRVCYEQLRDTSSTAPNVTEALKFLDFIELTDKIMQTIETQNFGKLTPETTNQQTEETVTDEFVLTYTASYTKNTDSNEATGSIEDVEIKGNLLKKMLI